ncbi:MAG: hypothetical protein J0I01_05865 [Stenotrophomonas nitritireducens]|uniref:Uncharacterized protein n=1 Tax=Stenotrophomonas nitritireducens TaxID=83617 RepID=A0A9D8KZT2_9GAMM|nr:hypothetical protein [Stenotrophomonas nitritireducens]MBN8791738.1 hypothetical protein [Stenotrophomonas nitritireducens]MBN8795676.1 hypothetical protein [Stenotrophomonas nitritireducens]MBN8798516.1 hypothetical protein [Stenotrophomonas nitritireducens]
MNAHNEQQPAAAPADTWFADQLTAMGEVIPLAGTPAAPGIDLQQFRYSIKRSRCCLENHMKGDPAVIAREIAECDGLLALIDASPKGAALNEQFGSAEVFNAGLLVRDCCEAERADPDQPDTICISVDALTEIAQRHAAATSPKGYDVYSVKDVIHAARMAYRDASLDEDKPLSRETVMRLSHALHAIGEVP